MSNSIGPQARIARRRRSPSRPISDVDVAELLPLLPALVKAMNRLMPEVPNSLKSIWRAGSLAPRHAKVLLALAIDGPMSVTDLSTRLDVGLPAASLLVAELSRAGVVARSEDEADRRRTLVDLAPAHRRAVVGFLARRTQLLRSALEPLEPSERAALIKGLRSIVAALEAAANADKP